MTYPRRSSTRRPHGVDLKMRHHIGVRAGRETEVLDLDQNYFSDED